MHVCASQSYKLLWIPSSPIESAEKQFSGFNNVHEIKSLEPQLYMSSAVVQKCWEQTKKLQ